MPSLRRTLLKWADRSSIHAEQRIASLRLARLLHPKRVLRLTANLAVVAMVLILPLVASSSSASSAPESTFAGSYDASRPEVATSAARGLLATARNPLTTTADGTKPLQTYTTGPGDTLLSIANFYGISPESLGFANGISDPTALPTGRQLLVPPENGALYTVQAGETVPGVAARFRVDPAVIMSWNRLYFEPEHFAPGQLIFIKGADLPGFLYQSVAAVAAPVVRAPSTIARPASPTQVSRTGRLTWPVGGIITQRFRPGHLGVDLAAPYGSGLAVPEDGTVISTGWVAVGGIHVKVKLDSGLTTAFYHQSAVFVAPGQRVTKGQIIGAIGLTGVTTGPHVHWECQIGSSAVDCLSQ